MDCLDLLAVQGTHESSPTPQFKSISSLALCFLYGPTLTSIHGYWKNHSIVSKVMSLLFNMLSRLVIAFLPMSKGLLISWLHSPSAVILESKKSVTVSIFSPSICLGLMGPDAMILVFWMWSFKPSFSLSSHFHQRLFSSSSLSAIRVVSSVYLRLLIFPQQSWFQLVIHPAWHFVWCTLHIS